MNKDEVLCSCFRITVGDIEEAIDKGASSLEDIQDQTGFGTACGSCIDEFEDEINKMLEK